jgi:hypothetical protein
VLGLPPAKVLVLLPLIWPVPDGTLRGRNSLPRGYREAKDTQDDLDTEIKKKTARGPRLSFHPRHCIRRYSIR